MTASDRLLAARRRLVEPTAFSEDPRQVGGCHHGRVSDETAALGGLAFEHSYRPSEEILGVRVLSQVRVDQPEIERCRDEERQISELVRDRAGALPERGSLLERASEPAVVGQVHRGEAQPPRIAELLRQSLGLPGIFRSLRELPEGMKAHSKLEVKIGTLLEALSALRLMGQDGERLLETRHSLPIRRAGSGLGCGTPQVAERLVPDLGPKVVNTEGQNVRLQIGSIERLDRLADSAMEDLALRREELVVDHSVNSLVDEVEPLTPALQRATKAATSTSTTAPFRASVWPAKSRIGDLERGRAWRRAAMTWRRPSRARASLDSLQSSETGS